jgi:hypothetical protein
LYRFLAGAEMQARSLREHVAALRQLIDMVD